MPAIADLLLTTLHDGYVNTTSADVANDKTFSPAGFIAPGVAKWNDRSGGIPIGYPIVTLQLRPPTQGSRVYKTTLKLVLPTLEQTSPSTATGIQPAPTKAYDCSVVCEFMIPDRSVAAERLSLITLLTSLLVPTIRASDGSPVVNTGNIVRSAVVNFDPPF